MAIINYKPTTPGRRNMSITDYSAHCPRSVRRRACSSSLKNKVPAATATAESPFATEAAATARKYRIIDFKRQKIDMAATVLTLEYDPNRSAFIALVQYEDGEKRYIIAPHGLKVGDKVVSGTDADIKPGNALPLANIPTGTFVHNVELYPGKGAQLARSAGNMAQLMAKENGMALLRLPSGELRNVPDRLHGYRSARLAISTTRT